MNDFVKRRETLAGKNDEVKNFTLRRAVLSGTAGVAGAASALAAANKFFQKELKKVKKSKKSPHKD